MTLPLDLENELRRRFGHPAFRPGQRALVEALLQGRDALGVMPTGGGKSLCFQLPAALREGTALVVSPLIALMKDQVDALRARGIAAEAFNSSMSAVERRRAREALEHGRIRLVYMAPERMQAEGFMELLARVPLSLLAIDEAHCISHWGHDFRPDYRRLGELRRLVRGPDPSVPVPVMALTATATQQVQADILERLGMRSATRVITGFRRTNLAFEVRKCSGRAEKLRVLRELIAEATRDGGAAVIYAATRKNVERVASELGDARMGYYHAGLTDAARATAQDEFLSGAKPVLVATNAFGMGIDKPNVRLVAHYDIPGSVEAYYQEAGRAGRDGLPARCVLLFNYADVATQEFFIERGARELAGDDSPEDDARPGEHLRNQKSLLKQLVRYAYGTTCRQQLILGYFGDPEAQEFQGCGQCDCCRPAQRPLVAADEILSLAARQALAAVARVNGRFGKSRIGEMLKGSQAAGLLASGLQHLPTYGLLRDWSMDQIRELLDLLLDNGALKVSGLDYPLLALTPQGAQIMRGQSPLMIPESAAPAKAARAARSSGERAHARESVASGANPELLERLKEFRREEARKQSVPAYVIFHDKTLVQLASRAPQELGSLAGVPGMGPKKLELYGERLLELLRPSAAR